MGRSTVSVSSQPHPAGRHVLSRSATSKSPGRRRTAAVVSILLAAIVAVTGPVWLAAASPTDPCAPPTNEVTCENSKPGNPETEWDVIAPDDTIEGFATQQSVDVGETVSFKVKTNAPSYTIKIFRLGYYGGDGARLITSVTPTPRSQPACLSDVETGLFDCGNWQVSASWSVPTNTVSGVFLAVLRRADTGGESHMPFVIRKDSSTSDLLFQTSDTTWQAYNRYGGANFYPGGDGPKGRAYKLSYNRPTPTHGNDFLFAAEYPMLRFLERNGYDATYTSGIDSDRRGDLIRRHKTFLSVGHDEYWSGPQRANVEAARNAGVNLAFFAGNDVYWKTRYENSIDSSTTPYRTLVCYKETWDHAASDPQSGVWTGTWRDPRFSPPKDGGIPENALVGTAYMSNFTDLALKVPADEGKLRIWRNTSLANQSAGQTATLAPHTIGYESNEDLDNGFRPAGLIRMSETTGPTPEYLRDFGTVVTPGTTTHHITMYRHSSGARVFSAGTIQWSWGLDEYHDGTVAPADANMQQATVNLLADMGAQPLTRMTNLVAASATSDAIAPTSTITSPSAGFTVANGTEVTIAGTSADAGGRVGGVEVSTDSGRTWHPATGRESWSYTFKATGSGAVTWQVRASDDSGNIESPKSRAVTVNCPCTMFGSTIPKQPDGGDPSDLELGLRFTPMSDGYINGIRFYKAAANTGSHTGTLWSESGEVIATGTFSGESGSGWQAMEFAEPVPVAANTTYVASYRARNGRYAGDADYFHLDQVAEPLAAPRSSSSAPNGVYASGGSFPSNAYKAANYYVDVIFNSSATDVLPPTVSTLRPDSGSTGVLTSAPVSAVFSERVDESTIQFSVKDSNNIDVAGAVAYNESARSVTFTPSSALAETTTYTASLRASDLAGNAMSAPRQWSFTTRGADSCPCSLFSATVPTRPDAGEAAALELGTRIVPSGSGWITAVRFYKSVANTGTHTGSLWSASGQRLATGTFTNETASGWQTLQFQDPVQVTGGAEYIASYYTPTGHYSADANFFASDFVNEPLRAPAGQNGVFKYGVGGGFPTSNAGPTNYWVDVLFQITAPPDTRAPTVSSTSPSSGATRVDPATSVSAVFSEPMAAGSIGMNLTGPSGAAVSGSSTYDATTRRARFTPSSALTEGETYTARVQGADLAGNAMAPVTWSFTVRGACPCSLFGDEQPSIVDSGDGSAVELGVRIVPSSDGYISGVRFYKSGANTGTHSGTLWTNSGAVLASGTFIGETASGWQTLYFTTPVAVSAGETYVASYRAPNGHYSANSNFFADEYVSSPLTVPAGSSGVYAYGGGFPTETYLSTNYWVDALFELTLQTEDTRPPVISGTTPLADATNISPGVTPTAVFSEPISEPSIQFTVKDPAGTARSGSVSYDAATRTARFTPTGPLDEGVVYTASVRAADVAGNTMTNDRRWSFTVWSSAVCPCSLLQDRNPVEVDSGDTEPVELGVRFTTAVDGFISGVRFYKSAANTGTHTGSVWSAAGTRLATGTFTSESASGWQTLTFATPLAVSAGTTYVASYHAPNGHFAVDRNYFVDDVSQGPLTAPAGTNGVYRYGSDGGFPTSTINASNYWVDPLFQRGATADQNPPTVTTVVPSSDATGVSRTTSVSGVFSEPVNESSIQFVLTDPSGAVVTATRSYDAASRMARLTPVSTLAEASTYTATLTASDLSGNAMTSPRTWTFTTADVTAPGVLSVSPATGDTGVARTSPVSAAFSEQVRESSITLTVRDGATDVPGSVGYDSATRTARFTASGGLPEGRTLTASVRAADLADNTMSSPVTWSFSVSDASPPTVSDRSAVGSGTSATVTWTTNEPATTRVDYGTTTALGQTVTVAGTRTAHSVSLTGLTVNTRYYYRVISADAAANSTTSPSASSSPAEYVPTVTPITWTSAAEFAGTNSGTYVSSRSGGEVVLNPTAALQEFSGTAVPSGWTSTSLGSGSSVTVANGVATVSGRFFRTTATFGSGREMDLVGILRPTANQWLGLTNVDFSSTTQRWAAFHTTSVGGLEVQTRTGSGVADVSTTQLPASLLGQSRRFEIDWTATTTTYRVDGTVVATHGRAVTPSMYVAVRDGAVDSNSVVLDSVWVTPYAASGTFTSAVIDAGAAVVWGDLTATTNVPAGTGITYQVRTGSTATPGTGWSAWVTVATGADIPGTARYLQYRATLTTGTTRTTTPALEAVRFAFGVA